MSEKNPEKKARKKYLLSKSTFIKGLQCQKALYLYKNRYFLRDPLSPEQRAKFSRGTNVGVYARELFPGGTDAAPKTHFQMAQSVEKTQNLIEEGKTEVIYEAAFAYDDVVVALDILYKTQKGWKGIEVKSSKKISETYRWDVALQYYVISGAGLKLEDISIAYINTNYIKDGVLNPHHLFLTESIKEDAINKKGDIAQYIKEFKNTIQLKKSPGINIGSHCNTPYPCEFIGHCWKKIPKNGLHHIEGLEEDNIFRWFDQGVYFANELPAEIREKPEIKIQADSLEQQKTIINKEKLQQHLQSKNGRAALMCSHSFAPAIPLYNHTSPYEEIPYGISMVDLQTPPAEKNHQARHLLAKQNQMPYEQWGKEFIDITQNYEVIWVWDMEKENRIIQSCKKHYPGMNKEWDALMNKLQSMQKPFAEKWIVNPLIKYQKNPTNILRHNKIEEHPFPDKIRIPEEAAAFYEKLIKNTPPAEAGSDAELEIIEKYMNSVIENQYLIWSRIWSLA